MPLTFLAKDRWFKFLWTVLLLTIIWDFASLPPRFKSEYMIDQEMKYKYLKNRINLQDDTIKNISRYQELTNQLVHCKAPRDNACVETAE